MFNERNSSGDVVIEEKTADSDDILVTSIPNDEPQQKSGFDELASSVKEAAQEVAQKTGEVFNKATESIGKAIDSALSARGLRTLLSMVCSTLASAPSIARRWSASTTIHSKASMRLCKRVSSRADQKRPPS